MKQRHLRPIGCLALAGMTMGAGVALLTRSVAPPTANITLPSPSPGPTLQYRVQQVSQSTVHTLVIPANHRYRVVPAIAPTLRSVDQFAREHRAIAAINGGFFDPENQQSTSAIMLQGKQVADPRANDRLVNNPALVAYLPKILNRSEFRRYQCGPTLRYQIALHRDPSPAGCQLLDALGGGPRLLPQNTAVEEGFLDTNRDPLGSDQPNARSAIGITASGDIVWVMVAQLPTAFTDSGLSLRSLTQVLRSLGAESAMNLDGGSSSALYVNGKRITGKVDETGQPVNRAVKSVLLVQE